MIAKSKYATLIIEKYDELYSIYANLNNLACYRTSYRYDYSTVNRIENYIKQAKECEELISMLRDSTNYDKLPKFEKLVIDRRRQPCIDKKIQETKKIRREEGLIDQKLLE